MKKKSLSELYGSNFTATKLIFFLSVSSSIMPIHIQEILLKAHIPTCAYIYTRTQTCTCMHIHIHTHRFLSH